MNYTTPRPPLIAIRNDIVPALWTFLGETREHMINHVYTHVELTEEEERAFMEWLDGKKSHGDSSR